MITKEYLQQELAKRIDGYKRGVATTTDNIIAEMKSILVLVNALQDYEKKYNEALEVMRQWIAPCHTKKQLDVMKESVFPELRESEDERIRKYLIDELKVAKSVGELKFTIPQPTREECIAYLEKQKEQKPAEWSEEDENMLWNIISIVGESKSIQADEMLDWLKSLRPQPHWKPSKEQMNYLSAAVIEAQRRHNESTNGFTRYHALKEIYEQLLKL